ncbi:MAG: LUD domain-containing protein [Candidatus Bathyarchaeia archaeon]
MRVEEIAEWIMKAQNDSDFQVGITRAIINFTNAVDMSLSRLREHAEIAEYVRTTREKVLGNLEYYIDQTMKSITVIGGHAYFASNPEEAVEIINKIIGEGKKIIVKSKSLVTDEISLRGHLAEKGHEVYETDLGELLIQISKEKPMHTVSPAIHISRERASQLLGQHIGLPISKEAKHEELVSYVREFLREKFVNADIGITGANVIAADTGSVFLVHNEGNISNVAALPPVLIIVASVDKIMPTFKDAILQLMVQSAYAGLYPPTYVNVISGVSSTADIEYYRVYGVHGPKKVHVILYDGGRIKAAKDPVLKEQLLCIKCGRCQVMCPIWDISANVWGGKVYGGPMGVGLTAITESVENAKSLSWFCLLCKACKSSCPVNVDSAEICRRLRSQSIEDGRLPLKVKDMLENIYKYRNPFGLPPAKRDGWADANVPRYKPGVEFLYYVGDMGSYDPRAQIVAKTLAKILSLAGVSFGILGVHESCSGSEAYEVGEAGLFEDISKSNVELFKGLNVEKIVALSPHSYNVMKNCYGNFGGGFDVKHYTQLLWELIQNGKLRFREKAVHKRVTYHDPCFLGRWNNEYEAPRSILEAIPGINIVEMKRNKQNSFCCGGGSGNCYTGFGCGLITENERSPSRSRVREAYETGADILAVACPSCLIMLEEAAKEEGLDDKLSVKDITEIVISAIE